MIVLTPSTSPQTFNFIPRDNTFNVMELTDDQTNITVAVAITSSTVGDYINTITATFWFNRRTFLQFSFKSRHKHYLQRQNILHSSKFSYIFG